MTSISRVTLLKTLAGIAVMSICYSWLIRPWILHWGAADPEIVEARQWRSVRAVTIGAPPERVWPWLAQIGQSRGGFYSYAWLENLLGCDIVNAAHIHPEWQVSSIGERIDLAPPARFGGRAYMVVAELIPGKILTLVAPTNQGVAGSTRRMAWSFLIKPLPGGRSRLIARGTSMSLDLPHFVMERAMLLGIKERSEAAAAELPAHEVDWQPFRKRGLFGYRDKSGAVRIAPRFVEAGVFEDGHAVVATKVVTGLGGEYERRYGVIDSAGRFSIPPTFRYISHFREKLAIATLDGVSFGYIGPEGAWVLPPRFAEAADFESGLALVLPLGELAFARVDTEGRVYPLAHGASAAVIR